MARSIARRDRACSAPRVTGAEDRRDDRDTGGTSGHHIGRRCAVVMPPIATAGIRPRRRGARIRGVRSRCRRRASTCCRRRDRSPCSRRRRRCETSPSLPTDTPIRNPGGVMRRIGRHRQVVRPDVHAGRTAGEGHVRPVVDDHGDGSAATSAAPMSLTHDARIGVLEAELHHGGAAAHGGERARPRARRVHHGGRR